MINYKEYKSYNEEEILDLYKSVGWSNYYLRPKLLRAAYENSLKIIAAYNDNELVGIIRIVGDGHSIVYVQDLLIKPVYQRQKIGSTLLNMIFDEYKEVYQIVLITDDSEKTKSFYESLGMINNVDYQCRAFFKINNA